MRYFSTWNELVFISCYCLNRHILFNHERAPKVVRRKNESGSAHVVIIIVLIVAIVGLLCFVFWQQINGKSKSDVAQSSTKSNPAADTKPTTNTSSSKVYTDSKKGYSFNYPSDWTVGASTCRVSCNNTDAFTLRSPDFKQGNDGTDNGALVVVSPNAVSGSLQSQRKQDESITEANAYTYYYNFTDTIVGGGQAYKYYVADHDHSKAGDEINIVFSDRRGAVWLISGTGASVTSTSQYDGVKALELIKSTWKWL